MSWKNKNLAVLSILTFVFCAFALLTGTVNASTGVSPSISFEGKIVNASGVNIANGNYDMEFTMYTGCSNEPTNNTGCTLAWTEDYINGNALNYLAVNGGTFQVNLGQLCPWAGSTCQGNTNTGFNWNTYPIYMSMQIGGSAVCTPAGNFTANCAGDGVTQPYILMTSTPYAQNTGTLGNIAAAGFAQLAIGSQTFTGSNTFEDSTNSATAFQIDNNGPNSILDVDTSANQVVFGNTTTNVGQVVFDDGNSANTVTINAANSSATYILTLPTVAPSTSQCLQSGAVTAKLLVFGTCGSAGINNGFTLQSSASFDIQSTSGHVTGVLEANGADTLDLKNSSAVTVESFGSTGAALFENSTNSTTAFQVQTASAANVLNVDTTNSIVDVGSLAAPTTPIVTQAPIANAATGSGSGTAYTYEITAVSWNGDESLGVTEAVASNGANLSTNPITLNWTTTFAPSYNIYRTASAGTPATTGLVGTVSATSAVAPTSGSETGTILTLNFPAYSIPAWTVGQAISLSGFTMSTGPAVNGTHEILSINTTSNFITVFISSGVTANVNTPGTATGLLAFIDNGFSGGAQAPALATTGSLTPGATYDYEVTALDNTYVAGGTIGQSAASPQLAATVNAVNESLTIDWTPVSGARGYNVYRTISSGSYATTGYYYTVYTNSFTDTGATATGTNTTPPTTSTAYANTLSDNANANVTIGSNGPSTAQLYVGGQLPTAAIGTISIGGNPYSDYVQGNYAYVANGASSNLQIIDVSNPAKPVTISTIATGSSTSLYVQGNYAYVANYWAGNLQIINISDPASPVTVSTVATGSYPNWVVVQGNYAYVTDVGPSTLQIINISNPANPVNVGSVATNSGGPFYAQALYVQGNYAYVSNGGDNSLQIINISNPANPVTVGSVANVGGGDVYVQGRYAYVTGNNDLYIIDVSNPANPRLVSSVNAPQANDVYVQGNYAYVTNGWATSFQVFNISNPAVPVSVGTVSTGSGSEAGYVVVQGSYVYIADGGNDKLLIYNMGGAYIQQLKVGGTETGTLQVDSNANVSGSQSIVGGLTVGSSAQISGNVGVNGNLTIAGLTQLNGVTAINGVYGGYSSIGLATPSAPTITFSGVVGAAATWSYEVEAVDAAGNTTAASAVGSITASDSLGLGDDASQTVTSTTFASPHLTYNVPSGQPYLVGMGIVVTSCSGTGADNGTYTITSETTSTIVVSNAAGVAGETGCIVADEINNNTISWSAVTGAVNYYVFRTAYAAGGYVFTTGYIGSTSSTSLVDNGTAATATYLAQTTDSTNSFITKTATNSTTALSVQNASGVSILNVDTTNTIVDIGALAAPTTPIANQAPLAGTVTGTAGATTYTYEVTSVSANGAESLGVTETSGATLAATITSGTPVAVNFTTNGAAYYKIYRIASGGTPSSLGLVGTATTSPFSDTGYTAGAQAPALATTGSLLAAHTYDYEVTALDNTYVAGGTIGQSAASTQLAAVTNAVNTSLTISWAAVPGARAYNVYRTISTGTYATTGYYYTVYTNNFTDTNGTAIGTNVVPPTVSTAYGNTLSDNANANVTIGSNGTATGQLYVGGSVPTAAIGTAVTGTNPIFVYVQGKYAYVSTYNGLFQILNISNPANPVIIGSITITGAPILDSIYVSGSYAYVTNKGSGSLLIFNVSNPANPVSIGSVATGLLPDSVYVQGSYAYVTNSGANSLQVFNVSNPASPISAGSVTAGANPDSVYVQGNYAYVANYTSGTLQIIDISNTADPVIVGTVNTGTNPYSVYVQGRYAYVANYGASNLQIFDVSNPASPVQVGGNITTGTNPESVYVSGRYAYVANDSSSTLQVFDLGGAYVQQLQAGGVEVGTLQVDANASVGGDETITGGLTVGSSLNVAATAAVGGLNINALGSPTNPALTVTCSSTCATSYSYAVTATNSTGNSAPSPTVLTNVGNAALNTTTQYNRTSWASGGGATNYNVYRTVGGAAQGLIGTVSNASTTTALTPTSGSETGTTLTLNFSATSNWVVGQGISLSGFVMNTSSINGTWPILSVTATSITVNIFGGVTSTITTEGTALGALAYYDTAQTAGLAVPTVASTGAVIGAPASGSNVAGANIIFDASTGTGAGGSGSFIFYTAVPNTSVPTRDAADGTTQVSAGTTTPAFSHTTGSGLNRLLIVSIATDEQTSPAATVTSVVWDSLALTKLTAVAGTSTSWTDEEIWYLVNPPASTTANVNVTVSISASISAGSMSFYNVNQATPIAQFASNFGEDTAGPSITLSGTNPTQLVINALANETDPTTVTTGETSQWALNSNNSGGWAATAPVTSSTTITGWGSLIQNWSQIALAINAAPAGATTTNTLSQALTINQNGQVLIGGSQNSTTTFQVQNASAASILDVDTTDGIVLIGSNFPGNTTQALLQLNSVTTLNEAAGCTISSNQGALYYNTNSNSIRACINGSWQDLVSTQGLSTLLFGVVPNSGNNPGDLIGASATATAGNNTGGPCKINVDSVASGASSVYVNSCLAYSGGREVSVPATQIILGPSPLMAASSWQDICLNSSGVPALLGSSSTTAGAQTFNNLTTSSATTYGQPLLCLGTVATTAVAGTLSKIYDLRTFTNTDKTYATITTAADGYLGAVMTPLAGTSGLDVWATSATGIVQGVVVAANGAVGSAGTPNIMIATAGPQWIYASSGTLNDFIVPTVATTPGGVAAGTAVAGLDAYDMLGVELNTYATSCAAQTFGVTDCQYSLFTDLTIQ